MELPCFQTTPIANLYHPHPSASLRRPSLTVLLSFSFPSCNGILAAQAGMLWGCPLN